MQRYTAEYPGQKAVARGCSHGRPRARGLHPGTPVRGRMEAS